MRFKEIITLSENRHGYDDSGMSLAPGNDEGPDSWDYSAAHDRIGAGDPRRRTKLFHHRPVDVPHDVHINGRKWKTFGSKSHAENVARKLAANGKNVSVQPSIPEGVAEGSLNEFAPNGFNGDDGEEFNPRLAKMAYDEGVVKGVSLSDGATTQRAMAINDWDKHDGGIYSQHFAKGFKAGRLDKIRHNNKQYNLNLKLMKDGSIRHGEQGVAEGGSQQAAIAVAKKASGKYTKDGQRIRESATAGSTSAGNIATVVNPDYAYNANQMGVKSVNALDQDKVSLFGAPMETMDNKKVKKASIIKRR